MFGSDIPLLNVNVATGPGSQEEGDRVLDYMKMPSEMHTYDIPILPEAEQMAECPKAMAVLHQLQNMLSDYQVGASSKELVLTDLPEEDFSVLNQIFGEGEVAAIVGANEAVRIQETVMAGVWRLRYADLTGNIIKESLEVADIPEVIRSLAFQSQRSPVINTESIESGVLNAPSVLVEIMDQSVLWQEQLKSSTDTSATAPHVINLSLLPFSPEDHAYLNEVIGAGTVRVLSRGYGNCRITSTQINGLWRVQYFNSTDQLILDTLEITDIPAVACAAQEDIEDSAERLREIRDALMQ